MSDARPPPLDTPPHGAVDPDVVACVRAAAGSRATLVETHASLVILGAERAFKLKKPVRFPYLDFSTPALRQAACAREVEINRRFAPELYLGLGQVTRGDGGGLAFDGAGAPVEPVVIMRRFPEADVLGALATAGSFTVSQAAALAETIAATHRAAEVRRDPDATARLEATATAVLASLAAAPDVLDPARIAALGGALGAAFARHRPLLEARAAAGDVRRCHGDLHLDNLVLWNGRPTPFDALEFDESLATIDVFYDLAFALMDLVARGADAQGAALLSATAALTEPAALDGLAALPLFIAVRALVRARVALDRRSETADPGARTRLAETAQARTDLAARALAAAAPRLVAVGGLSGTGKSTLALALAPGLAPPPGAVILRSDYERKALAGVHFDERLPPEAYGPDTGAEVYARLFAKAEAAMRAGRTALLDAVFARTEERDAAEAVAIRVGVPFTGLWLEAPGPERERRVSARRGDPSDADARVAALQSDYDLGRLTWARVDTGQGPATTCARAAGVLRTGA